MAYETKPYAFGGLGKFLRAVTYKVDEERVQEISLSGTRASIARKGASAVRDDRPDISGLSKLLRRAFNIGDVRVSNSGSQHVFKKVACVDDFIAAVEGRHGDVFPKVEPEPPKPLDPNTPMEDFVIVIPRPPGSLDSLGYRLNREGSGVSSLKSGQMVREGDVIGFSGGFKIYAPVSGKFISYIAPYESFRGPNPADYSSLSPQNLSACSRFLERSDPVLGVVYESVMATIQPVKGSYTLDYIQKAYHDMLAVTLEWDRHTRKVLSWWVPKEDFAKYEQRCLADAQLLANMKGRYEPVTPPQVPPYIPFPPEPK